MSLPGVPNANPTSVIDTIVKYIEQQRAANAKQTSTLMTLQQTDAQSTVQTSTVTKGSTQATSDIPTNPLGQLGSTVAQQVAANCAILSNNSNGIVSTVGDLIVGTPLVKSIQAAQATVLNTISAALTSENNLVLYFLQQLAKQTVVALGQKRQTLLLLQENIRLLYNALVILVAGSPMFTSYLRKLREALLLLASAENTFTNVQSVYVSTNNFQTQNFAGGQTALNNALALMQPAGGIPAVQITQPGLLAAVGIPSQDQQLTMLLSIPQLSKNVLQSAQAYFLQTLTVNSLISAFLVGYNAMKTTKSSSLQNYTVSIMTNINQRLTSLINRMAVSINGSPTALNGPISASFQPKSSTVTSAAIGWISELRALIAYSNFTPGSSLQAIQVSNTALAAYQAAVTGIKNENNRTEGGALLQATEGQEVATDLESQLLTFTLAANSAIVTGKTNSNILTLGQNMITRLGLSLEQDAEITVFLTTFINAPLPAQSTLTLVGGAILGLLNNFGMDRAADLLLAGNFGDFLNLNSKSSSYAGAALSALAALKGCLTTTEDQQQLVAAEQIIKQDNATKQVLSQTQSVNGVQQQIVNNNLQDKQLNAMEQQTKKVATKCGIPETITPGTLLGGVAAVLGVSLQTPAVVSYVNAATGGALTKVGQGIL